MIIIITILCFLKNILKVKILMIRVKIENWTLITHKQMIYNFCDYFICGWRALVHIWNYPWMDCSVFTSKYIHCCNKLCKYNFGVHYYIDFNVILIKSPKPWEKKNHQTVDYPPTHRCAELMGKCPRIFGFKQ